MGGFILRLYHSLLLTALDCYDMQQELITFELPAHPLPKIALKLESLLNTIVEACHEHHPIIHQFALNNILEVVKIIEKPELKSHFLKELIRINHQLSKLQHSISDELDQMLNSQIQFLIQTTGRFAKQVRTNEFLQSIKSVQSSGSECELSPPQLLLWLGSDSRYRKANLTEWFNYLRPLYDTVYLYLSLLRETALFEQITPKQGFFQKSFSSKSNLQLILLQIPKASGLIPRMQLGHYGFSLRLYDAHQEVHQDWSGQLNLGLCQL